MAERYVWGANFFVVISVAFWQKILGKRELYNTGSVRINLTLRRVRVTFYLVGKQ